MEVMISGMCPASPWTKRILAAAVAKTSSMDIFSLSLSDF